jgi:hypothetical protein
MTLAMCAGARRRIAQSPPQRRDFNEGRSFRGRGGSLAHCRKAHLRGNQRECREWSLKESEE